jgi:pantoate--beta-alanine ligase
MIHARTIGELQEAVAGRQPVLVPTMGALHEGHAALIGRATEVAGETLPVVVSVFVNPTQFAPNEDFTRYPRQLEADLAVCERSGATIVFAPEVHEVYPAGTTTVAEGFVVPALPEVATQPRLEDAFRPTHFAGVCKVVARLFDIVQPACAVFGEKDYQQLRVISAMVNEQSPRWRNLKIIPHPTVREPDGLAMSSRNRYLKSHQRKAATAIHEALLATMHERPFRADDAEWCMQRCLESRGLTVDYAVIRDPMTLMPLVPIDRMPCRALIAARLDNVRLIDNMAIGPANT